MIEKSVFQKSINDSNTQVSDGQKQNCPIQISKLFHDITNSPQSTQKQSQEFDYKTLYEQELVINDELTLKIQLLQQKVSLLSTQNQQLKLRLEESKEDQYNPSSQYFISLPKKSHKQLLFEEIRSFKENLPNSMKVIDFQQLDNFESISQLTDTQIISKNTLTSLKHIEGKNSLISSEQKSQKSIINSALTLKLINDQSLIDCLAIYGLSQQFKVDQQDEEEYYEGQLTYCSKAPHQIVKHSSKLIFPKKTLKSQVQIYSEEDAIQYAVQQISETLKSQDIKAFTLIFQPASYPNQTNGSSAKQLNFENEARTDEIIDIINSERRFYAVSVAFEDFDFIHNRTKPNPNPFENSLEENIFHLSKLQQNLIKLNESTLNKSTANEMAVKSFNHQNMSIKVSRKVITFFTKYPFIHFFEELLIHCLKESFQCRKNQMKKNISNLDNFDHTKTIDFLKTFYQNLNLQHQLNKKFTSKINEIFEIQFHSARINRFQTLSLELSKTLLKNFYSQIWAYPVLRLFTLDNFLDVFSLVMLQEKIIFVCENESILTSAIFLFSKVFMKPFDYPYPVVSMIPNEYDYFNAPFPIIYGCLNSKDNLVREKIPKIYKNVYIIMTPSGIQILANKNAARLQAKKSPKLRDKLLPYFIKMQNQQKQRLNQKPLATQRFSTISSLLGFNTTANSAQSHPSNNKKFNFSTNNRQLTHQIIEKVFAYLSQIKEQIPSKQKIDQIRVGIQNQIKDKNTPEYQNMDIDKETYERVKNKMLKKTSDPFVQRFLETQIVGLEILR